MPKAGLAIWLHGVTGFEDGDDVLRHADRLAENEVDIFIPCVKNPPGAVDFFTDVADTNSDYPQWDPLKVLIQACGEREVKVHPWFCVFPEGEHSRLLREHPEYVARFESRFPWACAMRPEVRDYAFRLYEDLARRYRPHGLHLDYIRQGGICTCEYCRSEMKAQNIDIAALSHDEPAWQQWCEWRVSRITQFVRRVSALTQELGIELSAAVFADYPGCQEQQAQDWLQWVEEGLLDYVFPMNYTNSLRVAVGRTVCHAALVAERVPLWEGLGKRSSASRLSPEVLGQQAAECLKAGARGMVVFSYPAMTEEDFRVLQKARE